MTWKEKLAALGLTEETISAGLRKKIAAYEKGMATLARLREDAADAGRSDEDREELTETADDYETVLHESSEELIASIDKWFKNKDRYQEMSKNLKRTPAKTTAAPAATAAPVAEPVVTPADNKPAAAAPAAPVQEPVQEPVQTTTQEPAQTAPVTEEPKKDDDKKKGSNTGWWIVGGVALLTGGLVWLKTRD